MEFPPPTHQSTKLLISEGKSIAYNFWLARDPPGTVAMHFQNQPAPPYGDVALTAYPTGPKTFPALFWALQSGDSVQPNGIL
jgi:hypothetical protein